MAEDSGYVKCRAAWQALTLQRLVYAYEVDAKWEVREVAALNAYPSGHDDMKDVAVDAYDDDELV